VATTSIIFSGEFSTSDWDGSTFFKNQSLTVPAGTDWLIIRQGGTNGQVLDVLTFNGSSLTLGVSQGDANGNGSHIWFLQSPTIGTFDLYGNSGSSERTVFITVDAVSNAGAIRGYASGGGYSFGSRSVSITTEADDLVLDLMAITSSEPTLTPNAGQIAGTATFDRQRPSSKTATGASTTMGWTHSPNSWTALAVIAIEDDTPAGPNTPINPSITDLLATSARLNWEQG